MTISKAQLRRAEEDGYIRGFHNGKLRAKEEAEKDLKEVRKGAIIELTQAAANLAKANASLTYSLSKIAEKLL